jgi:hypothetical protein
VLGQFGISASGRDSALLLSTINYTYGNNANVATKTDACGAGQACPVFQTTPNKMAALSNDFRASRSLRAERPQSQ